MARRFAVAFHVRVEIEADDADGAFILVQQGVEDLGHAREIALDVDDCPEAGVVYDALCDATDNEADVEVVELTAAGAA